jgi:hypothetical protein
VGRGGSKCVLERGEFGQPDRRQRPLARAGERRQSLLARNHVKVVTAIPPYSHFVKLQFVREPTVSVGMPQERAADLREGRPGDVFGERLPDACQHAWRQSLGGQASTRVDIPVLECQVVVGQEIQRIARHRPPAFGDRYLASNQVEVEQRLQLGRDVRRRLPANGARCRSAGDSRW